MPRYLKPPGSGLKLDELEGFPLIVADLREKTPLMKTKKPDHSARLPHIKKTIDQAQQKIEIAAK